MNKVISYWRNSLVDAERLSIDLSKIELQKKLSYNEIVEGKINKNTISSFFKKDKDRNYVDVLLFPIVANLKTLHGKSNGNLPKSLVPLCVPATLNEEGILSVKKGSFPWVPRDYLEPSFMDISVGTLEKLDVFLSSHLPSDTDWSEYWSYCLSLFKYVTNQNLQNFKDEDYCILDYSLITDQTVIQGTSRRIIDLYDHIIRNDTTAPLLKTYSSLENANMIPSISNIDSLKYSGRHIGQMSNEHNVSKSQRDSIHHFFTIQNGEMLAVNGPPGTGKTTLLQSIISSMWVEAAYKKAEPPIIVVSSTNNQPVTNVIESFGSINELSNPLNGRWLPNLNSYGLYLSSKSKTEDPKIQTVYKTFGTEENNGFPSQIEHEEYINSAEIYFLENCGAYANREFSTVEIAVEHLHKQLKETVDQLIEIIQIYSKVQDLKGEYEQKYPIGIEKAVLEKKNEISTVEKKIKHLETIEVEWKHHQYTEPWWLSAFSFLPFIKKKRELRNKLFLLERNKVTTDIGGFEKQLDIDLNKKRGRLFKLNSDLNKCENDKEVLEKTTNQLVEQCELMKIDKKKDLLDQLDCTYRYNAFKLATHYWEGQWLLEMKEQLESNYNESMAEFKQKKKWYRYAKLTPCFVTTLYMTPSFFSAFNGKPVPLYEYIDLLVIDEAGQVCPELAGASFALAKKGLIVGDTHQIEPIWNIPKSIDLANIIASGLASTADEAEQYILDRKVGASNGSVMHIGQRASKYQIVEDMKGMYLIEHRRCVPEIIKYCNELAYKGRLEPHRKSIDHYPLPHMGYANILGSLEKVGGSYRNITEAMGIVHWIIDNKNKLLDMYPGKKLEEVIAVVTPFGQQKLAIKRFLRKEKIKNIKVGTVHALQGAERPIVIFSSVYDGRKGTGYFFDRGINMLNVAVSRAKDSFLVFGDMRIFNRKYSSPSGILAKYLFADESNEIRNIRVPLRSIPSSDVEHIRDLEAHQAILKKSLEMARHEIHIVSPFLSSEAIILDELTYKFEEATKKGVKVKVYTDEKFNEYRGSRKTNFVEAIHLLTNVGVEVIFADRIHNKTLCVDNTMLVEGSFNWLSARRKPNDPWCRYEASIAYQGEEVAQMIKKVLTDLRQRKRKFVQRS